MPTTVLTSTPPLSPSVPHPFQADTHSSRCAAQQTSLSHRAAELGSDGRVGRLGPRTLANHGPCGLQSPAEPRMQPPREAAARPLRKAGLQPLAARTGCLCPPSLPLSPQATATCAEHPRPLSREQNGPSPGLLGGLYPFRSDLSNSGHAGHRCCYCGFRRRGGGTPQTLNAAVTLLRAMAATTATARLGENNNFNCVRIMGNWCYCTSFH